jgi:hypothetical protein
MNAFDAESNRKFLRPERESDLMVVLSLQKIDKVSIMSLRMSLVNNDIMRHLSYFFIVGIREKYDRREAIKDYCQKSSSMSINSEKHRKTAENEDNLLNKISSLAWTYSNENEQRVR